MGITEFLDRGISIVRNQIYFIGKLASVFLLASLLMACGGGGGSDVANTNNNGGSSGAGGGSGTGTGAASLSWLPPTQNTDGSSLTNLAGYKIYYGTSQGVYPNIITLNNVGLAAYVVENLSNGSTYYFVITAFNSDGVESVYSAVGSKAL